MDSYTWTTLNVKQNLLKTKQIENTGDLDNKERCLYIYFSLGINYNFIKFHNRKNPFGILSIQLRYTPNGP